MFIYVYRCACNRYEEKLIVMQVFYTGIWNQFHIYLRFAFARLNQLAPDPGNNEKYD